MGLKEFLKFDEPKYSLGEFVLYNQTGEFGNDMDRLLYITDRCYKVVENQKDKNWYYDGKIYLCKSTLSSGLPKVPVFLNEFYNASEENIRKLEDILIIEKN